MTKKGLMEMRNEKVAAMQNLIENAKAENRVVNEAETKQFKDLEAEIKDIDANIEMFDKASKIGMVEVKPDVAVSVEDTEKAVFENAIRGIVNADTPTTRSDAQVTIPTTVWGGIIDKVVEICPIFQYADRYNVGGKLVLPKYDAENSSLVMQYADEGTTAESGKVVISQIELDGYLSRVLAKISKSLINNSNFDIVAFVVTKMAQAIAVFIEKELLHGTEGKIEGLRGITADMTVTVASATALTTDDLMDVQDKVIDNYQGSAIWIMNRATRNAIRKLKDKDGNYLLNRDLSAKWGYTLLGKDVYCSDAMDTMSSGKTAIFYGDLSGLVVKISETANMQVLNERYAEEHMTGILGFMEMDAKVADTQKLAKLVMGA